MPLKSPWLLRWQGLISCTPTSLSLWSGGILATLLAALPFFSRIGLGAMILATGALWVLWSIVTPADKIGGVSSWVLTVLGISILTTSFSPVPLAAAKGLLKLTSYLGVYALVRKLIAVNAYWWDRLAASLIGGGIFVSVLALRQLYVPTEELARWMDPNSVAAGTVRIYGPLDNPNLLAGYLVPILPIAMVSVLRWYSWGSRLFILVALALISTATLFSYSRGGWLAMLTAISLSILFLVLRKTRGWSYQKRWLLVLGLLLIAFTLLILAASHVELVRIRLESLLAGREDTSNNFRITVWLTALQMIGDRPWLGIGPGNAAFNIIYPLYQETRFNALSAYSVPLEILIETGVPGLLAALGLAITAMRRGLHSMTISESPIELPAIASLAALGAMSVQGLTDTILYRPEVQVTAWFCLATLAQPLPNTLIKAPSPDSCRF